MKIFYDHRSRLTKHAAAFGLLVGIATLPYLLFSAPATAAIKTRVTPVQESAYEAEDSRVAVRINGDGAKDRIALSLEGGLLKINGGDPSGTPLLLSSVTLLQIKGGPGNDLITLRGMRGAGALLADDLRGRDSFFVAGNAGDDRILGIAFSAEEVESAKRGAILYGELRGGTGNDVLIGSRDADRISGGAGNDRIFGLDSADFLKGGPGADHIWGGDNVRKRDLIEGGAGDDVLNGGPGDDKLLGKRGNDTLIGGPGRDTMYQKTDSRKWPGGCKAAPPGLCNPIIN